jgi:hypothetical protein
VCCRNQANTQLAAVAYEAVALPITVGQMMLTNVHRFRHTHLSIAAGLEHCTKGLASKRSSAAHLGSQLILALAQVDDVP